MSDFGVKKSNDSDNDKNKKEFLKNSPISKWAEDAKKIAKNAAAQKEKASSEKRKIERQQFLAREKQKQKIKEQQMKSRRKQSIKNSLFNRMKSSPAMWNPEKMRSQTRKG